ncbi:MAG: RNA ligase family protein, partial [Spirochaetota bacterium]
GRSGYRVESSPYEQHRLFAEFVSANKTLFDWLPEGWRICGEWCVLAHGTIYDITHESPFVAFDIIDDENRRVVFLDFYSLCKRYDVPMVPVLHIGHKSGQAAVHLR